MGMTDVFIFIGFALLISSAFRRGFLHTLFWPLAILVASLLSIGTYLLSNNLWCVLATYVLSSFLIRKLLPVFQRNPNPDNPLPPSLRNRIMAIPINLIWGTFLTFLIVLALSLMPFEKFGLSDISYDVFHSMTYKKIAEIMVVPTGMDPAAEKKCPACDPQFEALIHAPMTQELLQDPRILKLISDPEFLDAVNKKDLAKLTRHPIVQDLRHDPSFLLKALRLHMTMRANAKY